MKTKGIIILRDIERRIASLLFGKSERTVEYSFVQRHIFESSFVLDVGSSGSSLAFKLAKKGYEICALDLRNYAFRHKRLNFIQADALSLPFRDNLFDTCVCVSTMEHIGKGQYEIDPTHGSGDLVAMKELIRVTKQGGRLIITTAWARKYRDILGCERYYDDVHLDKLANGLMSEIKEYYAPLRRFWKHSLNWKKVSKEIVEEQAFSLGARPLVCLVYKKI